MLSKIKRLVARLCDLPRVDVPQVAQAPPQVAQMHRQSTVHADGTVLYYDRLMRNIEIYDGTERGQEDLA